MVASIWPITSAKPDGAVGRPRPVRHALRRLGVDALLGRQIRAARVQQAVLSTIQNRPRASASERPSCTMRRPQVIGDADGGRAGAEEHDLLVA